MPNLANLKENVTLSPYTTYKIGGKADYFFTAYNKDDLIKAINQSKERGIPFFVLGSGANILVGDGGFRGLVIHNKAQNFRFDDNLLITESGALISDLIDLSLEKGLSGLEHFAGIPSTVGGAIRQNLHFLSPDRTSTIFIESIVKRGLVLEGIIEKKVEKDYFEFGYDDSIKAQISANLNWRNQKQPQLREFPSCGSVFKKIEGIGAGRLIEKCGLKGKQIGGAVISEKHANYIVNTGNATAQDVRELINLVQAKVFQNAGFKLEPEIEFIGEF